MIGLTQRQADALRFIVGFQAAKGFSPCVAEIAVGIGNSPLSKQSTREMLVGLEERGAIRRLPNRARAIEVIAPLPIPRAPDGEPLYFVRVGGAG
jgi:repressor LexA